MAVPSPGKDKHWTEKISRSGYFFGAVLLHLIVFVMIATWVIFPAFYPPPQPGFTATYLPPPSPPPQPPPPTDPNVPAPSHADSAPTPVVIVERNAPQAILVPVPNDVTLSLTPVDVQKKLMIKIPTTTTTISPARLKKIKDLMLKAGRTPDDLIGSHHDPRNIRAKFAVYLASYADGDWGCNTRLDDTGKIIGGSLPDLTAKIGEWSHGRITAEVVPTPLDIGGPELLEKKPPFIFFTGHKDFHLTDGEIKNLQDYLEMGGVIWGDNALAGQGSRFDVAFRREMKRVVPDLDKNFKPVEMDDPIFTQSWYTITKLPTGMNYYAEPMEHLDIDGKLAILYTPNDYSDMLSMRILPGDTEIAPTGNSRSYTSPLITSATFLGRSDLFFRNFTLPSCLACDQLGMNVIGYLLVRFDDDLLLTP